MSIETPIKTKTQGPIRWNAIIPFAIISTLIYLYFVMFFDLHMKNAIEWIGYKALGAEVNVAQFKSSFLKGHVQISKIQLTDKEEPDFNSIELGHIKFDMNWDALLRVKFVIEEIGVEGVQFKSKRAFRGKVAPPAPPSTEPGFAQQLQTKAINKLDKENQNNVLGDTAQFLKTGKFDQQIQNMQDQILSKKMINDLSAKWQTKQTEWSAKIKVLPTSKDITELKDKFNKIKFKDFANLQELDTSVKEADFLLKEIDSKNKQIQEFKSQFDADLKSFDSDYKNIEAQIKKDIDNIKSRFKIPKIDAASFAKELFMGYLTPYMQKLDTYKAMLQKYLPPKYAKSLDGNNSDKKTEVDSIQAHPRSSGTTYEFPIKSGYPLFWIQKVKISSQSNNQVDFGDIKGLISNITSNQRQIGLPTTAKVEGYFNKHSIKDIKLNAKFDNTSAEPIIKFDFGIGSYPLADLKLIDSKEGTISIPKTISNFSSTGEIVGFKKYDFKLNNTFNNVNFNVSSNDSTISEVLKTTFGQINKFDLQASALGELNNLNIDIRSSLGGDLERAFQNLLQNKIKEANEKVQQVVNAEVDKIKNQLNTQVESFKSQAQSEIKKIQTQFDEQKRIVEDKVAAAKKEFEDKANKAKKEAEDKAKKQVEQEVKKKADELKKRLGL